MPTLRVLHTGDGTDGTTWAKAYATLAAALTASTAGDVIWVASTHSENPATAQTWTLGTLAAPTNVYCVTVSGADGQSGTTTGAVCATSGSSDITIAGSGYIYGIDINPGTTTTSTSLVFGTGQKTITLDNCILDLGGSGGGSDFEFTSNTGSLNVFINCQFKFSGTGSNFAASSETLIFRGGSFISGTATPATLFSGSNGRGCVIDVFGLDMSNLAATVDLMDFITSAIGTVTFRDCRLPDSWTGTLVPATIAVNGARVSMHNCDDADTNYRFWEETYVGSIKSDTAVYNDAGADDGSAQGVSWQMVTTANAEFPAHVLTSPEIVKWNETTGSAITVTVEIVHNSQGGGTAGALTNAEAWLEVVYLNSTTRPQAVVITDRVDADNSGNLLATAADQATSTAAWTGDSAGWDTQKLAVTFTPQCKGYVHARVHLAKASATVYVDPLLTVT